MICIKKDVPSISLCWCCARDDTWMSQILRDGGNVLKVYRVLTARCMSCLAEDGCA